MSSSRQHHSRDFQCPLCNGTAEDPRGEDKRCWGYTTPRTVVCTRVESPNQLRNGSYQHARYGRCACGETHAEDPNPRPAQSRGRRRLAATYHYRDEGGRELARKLRYEYADGSKTFVWLHPDPETGEIKSGRNGVKPTLYRLEKLASAGANVVVWIAEGEKDVERLEGLGLLATTSADGSGSWPADHANPLAGRPCVILADNDEPGREHATQVARSLQDHVASIKIVEFPDLPEHGDVSDWLDADKSNTVERLKSIAHKAKELKGVDLGPPPKPKKEKKERKKDGKAFAPPSILASQTDLLMEIADRASLWRSEEGEGYASVPTVNGAVEHLAIESKKFNDWLLYGYWKENKSVPPAEALNGARSILSARARFDGSSHKQWIRVGETIERDEPVWWLDLADDDRRVVRITPGGWEIIQSPDVKLLRPDGMLPLPPPERGGEIDDLWEFCNVGPESRLLLLAYVTAAMRPIGPYPILVFNGEQGSAKSTSTRVVKRLFDPRKPTITAFPETPLDLIVDARSNWVLCFDNISSIGKQMSNATCQISTGGGMSRRKLHTDSDVMIFDAMRPVVLNGIDDFARAPDLVDRMVMVHCPPIDPSRRRLEEHVWGGFYASLPRLLGALLDAMVGALALKPTVHLASLPRMAEFTIWGEALCRHLGHEDGTFLDAFNTNREQATAGTLEDSAVYEALVAWGKSRFHAAWWGPYNEMLNHLREHLGGGFQRQNRLPQSARGLSSHIARIRPALRQAGIEVALISRTKNERTVEVTWRGADNANQPSFASPPSEQTNRIGAQHQNGERLSS